jgi:PIN domain nuclease of toxin-antitoxin system
MSGYLLDTHIWLWTQTNNTHYLEDGFDQEVNRWQRQRRVFISDASVWELGIAVSKGRVSLGMSLDRWVEIATAEDGFQMLALNTRILIESTRLPGDLHRDPGDRMLIATAHEHDLTIVTRDEKILKYGAEGHVKVLER